MADITRRMGNANHGQAGAQTRVVKQAISRPVGVFGGKLQQQSAAFTLPELLTIIGVVVVLALVWLPAHANMGHKTGILECKNNLRQVGWAMDMYTRDHQDYLPGPIWAGVFYSYAIADSGSMAHYLAPYFGLPAPGATNQDVEALKCPASLQAQPQPASQGFTHVCFLACSRITNSLGPVPDDIFDYPFGRPNGPYFPTVKAARIRRPSEQWVMIDADRQNVSSGATYYGYIPAMPVHNNRPGGPASTVLRNALYFDGAVRGLASKY